MSYKSNRKDYKNSRIPRNNDDLSYRDWTLLRRITARTDNK